MTRPGESQKWLNLLLTPLPDCFGLRPLLSTPPGNYTSRVWEYSSTLQSSDDPPMAQGSSSFSLKGELCTPFPSLLFLSSTKPCICLCSFTHQFLILKWQSLGLKARQLPLSMSSLSGTAISQQHFSNLSHHKLFPKGEHCPVITGISIRGTGTCCTLYSHHPRYPHGASIRPNSQVLLLQSLFNYIHPLTPGHG